MIEEAGKIRIEDFNYDLPEDRIAQYPVVKRDHSRMLIYNKGIISSDVFRNIDKYVPENSLLVFNNTRVIRARMLFRKDTGAVIEVFCLEPLMPFDYQQAFMAKEQSEWKCLIGNLKKWKSGLIKKSFNYKGEKYELSAERVCPEGEAWRVRFRWKPVNTLFGEIMEATGHIPLPPYVNREDEDLDNIRYQTVYSKTDGSVAAPTAGLHFTKDVLRDISNKKIKITELTLHVGAGTFKPVKNDDITLHEMHCEHFFVSREAIENVIAYQGNIIAVGTTSVRTLESLYWMGTEIIRNPSIDNKGLHTGQWDPYTVHVDEITLDESMNALLNLLDNRNENTLQGSTKIMIIPGYKFRVINGMVTNFHQPGSTLLLLVSAWTGEYWKKIYSFALSNNFRFLSFGDSSLLL